MSENIESLIVPSIRSSASASATFMPDILGHSRFDAQVFTVTGKYPQYVVAHQPLTVEPQGLGILAYLRHRQDGSLSIDRISFLVGKTGYVAIDPVTQILSWDAGKLLTFSFSFKFLYQDTEYTVRDGIFTARDWPNQL